MFKGAAVDLERLRQYLPEHDERVLSRAVNHPDGRAAVEDLDLAIAELARCEIEATDGADWEATRDELVAEIRRLAMRLSTERR